MRQKSGTGKAPSEPVIKDIAVRPASSIRPKRRSASYWNAYAVRSRSPRCAAAKASLRACITTGRRSSWKPARSGLPAIRRGRATSDEVKVLRKEARDLKEVVAEQALELRLLKKSMIADGGDDK